MGEQFERGSILAGWSMGSMVFILRKFWVHR